MNDKKKRKGGTSALHITIWTMNGAPLSQSTVRNIENAVENVVLDSSNRVLVNFTKV